MAQPNYKFKPYTPVNLKKKSFSTGTEDDLDKTLKSLEAQRANLDARLRAEGVDPETLGGEFDNRNLIEKALNLKPNQGLLMDFFEVLNRPVETVKGAIAGGVSGEGFLQGAWEGLSGQETQTGAEFLENLGIDVPDEGVARFAVDIATDIALDPLTYVPAGILVKGFKKLTKSKAITLIKNADNAQIQLVTRLTREFPDEPVENLLRRLSIEDTDEVMSLGKIEDFNPTTYGKKGGAATQNYTNSIEGLKSRKRFLEEKVRKAAELGTNTVDGFNIKEQVFAELEVINDIEKAIEGADDSLRVVMTPTGNRYDDIIVYKRYQNTELFTKVGSVEAKSMKGAFLSTATVSVENGAVTLKASDKAFDFGKEVNDSFTRLMNTRTGNGDETLGQLVVKMNARGRGARGENSIDFLNAIKTNNKKEVTEALNDFYFNMMKRKGHDIVYVGGMGKSKGFYAKLDDLKPYIKGKGGISYTVSSGKLTTVDDVKRFVTQETVRKGTYAEEAQILFKDLKSTIPNEEELYKEIANRINSRRSQFRLIPTFELSDVAQSELVGLGKVIDSEDIIQNFSGSVERVREIGILERLGQRYDAIGAVAKAADDFLRRFTNLFNLKAPFSSETYGKIKQGLGETMFELERRSARLVAIKEQLIKVDPKAGELLGELIEAGAYLDEAGNIRRISRRIGTSDFLDYTLKRIQDNVDVLLPNFADDAAKQNFLKTLNKIYQDTFSTTDDAFEVIQKGKATKLIFNGSKAELVDVLEYFNRPVRAGMESPYAKYLGFGEKRLSQGAKKLIQGNSNLVQEYRKLSDDVLRELVDKAGFHNFTDALSDQIGYMRHMMTKEAYEGLQRTMPGKLSIFAKPGSDTLAKRTFLGSAQEVNAGLREFMGLDVDLFDPNAFNAMEDLIKVAQRKMEQAALLDIVLKGTSRTDGALLRVVDNTKAVRNSLGPDDVMIKSFKEDFQALYKNLSPGSQQAFDDFLKINGYRDNSAIVMNVGARNVLKRVEKAYVELPQFVKVYDKFLNFWKGLTLVTPGFHMRNLFGNSFNAYAVGMDLPAQMRYARVAMMELNEFQEIGKKLAQGVELTGKEQELFELVKGYFSQGVSQTHRGIRDLEQLKDIVEVSSKAGGKIKTTYNNVLRFNFNVAEKMDDFQRYMVYRWSLDKTGDAAKAANTVAESLFDYSALTPFEKDYMKRIFPFYTFMKNNFIFQAKNIFVNPKQYARVGRAYKYAMEDLGGYNPEDVPDYVTENMWIPFPMELRKDDKEAISFLKANLPLSDFTELIENPFKKGVISLTAPVKLLIEFGAGRDLFTGAPLTTFPGERSAMEPGTGVLSGLRDRRGNLTITQSPLFQKILNDIGLRTPINLASTGVDLIDTLAGYQGGPEGLGDFMARMGVLSVQETDKLELTKLYQDLERLRELKKFYEQETGNQLPVLPRG